MLHHSRKFIRTQKSSQVKMEVEEEDEELGELCAEILENWNTPVYSDADESPFSPHHHQQLNTPCTNMETGFSMSKLKCKDPIRDFESQQKDNRMPKALKPPNNGKRSMGGSIIPVLVADTFYDKLLRRAVDGADMAALNNMACENEAEPSSSSKNNGKRTEKLSSAQCNSPAVNKVPKRSPISSEYRHMPSTSTAVPVATRNTYQRGFDAKSCYMLPSNKTIFDISIDDFGEKIWRNPGVDLSDFFNYGLNEKQWNDYCKLMQTQIQIRRFRGSKITADEGRISLKDAMTSLDKENNKCRPSRDSKNSSFHNSDVIIEIPLCDSSYEDEIRRRLIRKYGALSDDGGANLRSNNRNTPNMNSRMINGNEISPFPMDNYSTEDGEWIEVQSQKYYETHSSKSRERKTKLSITHSEVELTGSNEMGKQQSSRKQGEYSLSHVGQRSQKRVRLYNGDQTSHHKVDINLVESFYSPRMVQKEPVNKISPTNSYSSAIKIKIEEDPEKLKRRKERFSCPLQTQV